MANISSLSTVITDLFGVLDVLIEGVVNLITGNLLVLAVVTGFIALILGVIALIYKSLQNSMGKSIKMK